MGLFDEPVKKEPEIEVKYSDMDKVLEEANIKMGDIVVNQELVLRWATALATAKLAFEKANVASDSESIQKVATSIMIDEGKNGRMTTIREEKGQVPTSTPKAQPVATSSVTCGLCGSPAEANLNKASAKSPDFKCPHCRAVNWANKPGRWLPAKQG